MKRLPPDQSSYSQLRARIYPAATVLNDDYWHWAAAYDSSAYLVAHLMASSSETSPNPPRAQARRSSTKSSPCHAQWYSEISPPGTSRAGSI